MLRKLRCNYFDSDQNHSVKLILDGQKYHDISLISKVFKCFASSAVKSSPGKGTIVAVEHTYLV